MRAFVLLLCIFWLSRLAGLEALPLHNDEGLHLTRAVEVYKERFIAYSMGNFCTYRGISVSGVNGLAPIIKLSTDQKGKFFKGKIIPTYQSYATGVRIDPQNQVIKKIQELTKKDFPESQIQIAENGLITYLAQ